MKFTPLPNHLKPTFLFLVFLLILGGAGAPSEALSEDAKDLPPRAISVSPEYTGVIVPQGDDVSMDLLVANMGRAHEDIQLSLTKVPEGWAARIKTFSFGVAGVYVPSDTTKRLTLKVEPAKDVRPGDYELGIRAVTSDGLMHSSARLLITVVQKEETVKTTDVTLTTSYPVLQGPTDGEFEFSLDVESKLDKDTIYNLSAQGPTDWDIHFKPAYEDKLISSLRIKAGQNRSMAVVVRPRRDAAPGEYPIRVKVSSDMAQAEANLTVILTGTHKIDIGTPDGLLSLTAFQGKEANLSFYVKNSGSATQRAIRFLSFKPENWDVTFKPESIDSLAPGALQQVEVTVKPSGQALVGDYSVSLAAQAEKITKDLELRVTVQASTAWGWVGIGIIIFVILGLVILFFKMGRR
jgi:uncharacterized membrane protein